MKNKKRLGCVDRLVAFIPLRRSACHLMMLLGGLLVLVHTIPLLATNPRLSGGVKLCAGCSSPWPCQTAAACAANIGAEILYNAGTSANGCQEIWSMDSNGGNKINLTAKMYNGGAGFGHGPSLNQGTPTYSADGRWMIFPDQAPGSTYPCSAHAVAPGAGTDFEISVCDTATYSNCAVVRTVTTGVGHGSLHPQITRDNATLYWGFWLGTAGTTAEGNAGMLQWATFNPGTPPSIGTIHQTDFAGDGTGTKNWYEPADSDLTNGQTCWLYVTADNTITNPTLANVAIARYSLGGAGCPTAGTWNFVSTPYETPQGCYSEFWSFNQNLDSAITISSCFFTGAQSPPSVLDLVMAMGASGAGAIQLTGYNLAEQPEYAYPGLVSNPHWCADGTCVVFNLVTNASLQGQSGGFGGATGSSIWKYTVNAVPSQFVGKNTLAGQAMYK